ncbi:MAG: sulfatase [Bacteroidales bacterium]|nr:sulfatase [Bacteroidales bacterium]
MNKLKCSLNTFLIFILVMGLGGCGRLVDRGYPGYLPNIIIILADDLGYSDLSCYGSEKINTPNLDKMASDGMAFTNFWTTCNVCSPSRASLLTGRYPQRCGVPFALGGVYSDLGLQDDEITIAELLKDKGYSTAAIGKWHLGIPLGFNYTTHQGFNSSSEFHPNNQGFDLFFGAVGNAFPDGRIPLIENEIVVDDSVTVATVTDHYNSRAIEFIKENKENPFFIYFAHTRPHAPWTPNPRFDGTSDGGVYGDMVEELDASVGEVIAVLKDLELDEKTLVIFTSDNGAAITEDQRYGSNLPFRGGKGTTWDGGHRVPGIFYWPGKIAAGEVSNQMATVMDLLPTIKNMAGAELPDDRVIDGYNIWPLLSGDDKTEQPGQSFYYYNGFNLQAIRDGKWKLHLPREEKMLVWWESGLRDLKDPLLFNLDNDSSESINVADENPQVVNRLLDQAQKVRNELGSWDIPGTGQKDIERLLNDRTTLRILRSHQDHQNLGVSKLDTTTPEINLYYWEIAKENRRKKLEELSEKN